MGRQRFSPEQIIVKLREAEVLRSKGLNQLETAKRLEIAEQTLIRCAIYNELCLLGVASFFSSRISSTMMTFFVATRLNSFNRLRAEVFLN